MSFYILVYFQHEADRNTAIFPKVLVVAGLTLNSVSILMLPLDVSNARTNGGFPMTELWYTVYIIMALLIVVLIPFAIFYYEAEDPTENNNAKQIASAIKYEAVVLGVCVFFTLILWLGIGTAQVPYQKLESALIDADIPPAEATCPECKESNAQVDYQISFILYIISMVTFVGMFLFVLFGGIGMVALPMDLINNFINRPKFMTLQEYTERKVVIGERAKDLNEQGKRLQDRFKKSGGRPQSRRDRAAYNQFRATVFLLEEDYVKLEKAFNKGIGPKVIQIAWSYAQLVLGVLGIFMSLLWIIHIFVFMVVVPPPSQFLNKMFIDLENTFGLFGTVAYGCFAYYLLLAVIKGNFKFGLRVPFFFTIHPMKVGETLMNSFLFNILLILICSLTVTQFSSIAFSTYNRLTGINEIFNIGVRNLVFFKWFYYYYQWAFVSVAILAAIYFGKFRSDRRKSKKEKN
eukprot:CAMPEP_0168548398 /NCGR_PEP_ID=MMETSP0413-20121227/4536_1 /TAXON_ID=136452 /ORGANISM="Filamoeba nolandi, Strain NC-AS-23-1" /LENGTH=461 /DNA_ID=CAMNT_0008578691 /DNA_START=83 /DNA_END=1468 /DNA_ORIENTATION=+